MKKVVCCLAKKSILGRPWSDLTMEQTIMNLLKRKAGTTLGFWSHLPKKSLMENFIFCAVSLAKELDTISEKKKEEGNTTRRRKT